MRSIIIAVAAFGLTTAANATPVGQFNGAALFTSNNCGGIASTWQQIIFYFPPNLGNNGPGTSITLSQPPFNSYFPDLRIYQLASGSINGTDYVAMNGTHVFVNSTGGRTWQLTARITRQTPSTITATTTRLRLIGDIKNYDDSGTCDAHFDATLYSYPLP